MAMVSASLTYALDGRSYLASSTKDKMTAARSRTKAGGRSKMKKLASLETWILLLLVSGWIILLSRTEFCFRISTPTKASSSAMIKMTLIEGLFVSGSSAKSSAKLHRKIKLQQWLEYAHHGNLSHPQPEETYLPCLQYQNEKKGPENSEAGSFASCNVLIHARVDTLKKRRIPPQTKSNRTASLCLFIKNEQLYVNEFVDYHLAIGFDEIFIFDNSREFNLRNWGHHYKKEQTNGRVLVRHFSSKSTDKQIEAYTLCLETSIQRNHTWMGVMDTDEILVMKKHDHVVDLLEEYCQSGALSLYWNVFGYSYQTRYRPYPLAQRFQYRNRAPHQEYKTIGKISDIRSVHIHYMEVEPNRTDANGRPACQHDILDHDLKQQYNSQESVRIHSNEVAAVYHYWIKSTEEWAMKACWRGRPRPGDHKRYLNCFRNMSELNDVGCEVHDDSAWQALKRHLPEYAVLDEEEGASGSFGRFA